MKLKLAVFAILAVISISDGKSVDHKTARKQDLLHINHKIPSDKLIQTLNHKIPSGKILETLKQHTNSKEDVTDSSKQPEQKVSVNDLFEQIVKSLKFRDGFAKGTCSLEAFFKIGFCVAGFYSYIHKAVTSESEEYAPRIRADYYWGSDEYDDESTDTSYLSKQEDNEPTSSDEDHYWTGYGEMTQAEYNNCTVHAVLELALCSLMQDSDSYENSIEYEWSDMFYKLMELASMFLDSDEHSDELYA